MIRAFAFASDSGFFFFFQLELFRVGIQVEILGENLEEWVFSIV